MTPPVPPADADLRCPLCDYDLRGLAEPRCPECGFAFAWAELLDERRARHPWLFEHARRGRLVRAFGSTYARTALPWHFWRRVTPANPARVGRLVVYWLLACLPVLAAALPFEPVYTLARENLAARAYLTPIVNGHPPGPPPANFSGRYYSVRNFAAPPQTTAQVDALFPPPWSPAFAVEVWDVIVRNPSGGGPAAVTLPVHLDQALAAGWPWLSFACLSVFRWSMRRAKTNPAHVLRTTIYGCGYGLTAVAAVAAYRGLLQWPAAADWVDRVFRSSAFADDVPAAVWVVLVVAAAATVRLTVAYARYLRFHLPLATVLASQVIAVLVAFLILYRTLLRP